MTPAVSIILPTYNRASFLPEALASIRAQSFRDWELVVVDDGSTDQTRALVESWRREVTQPVSYVWQENRGAYAARNAGLDRAGAPLVAFFDSDDLWRPQHLEAASRGFGSARRGLDLRGLRGGGCDGKTGSAQHLPRAIDRPRRVPVAPCHSPRRDLRVIDDARAIECHVMHGIFCGLQNSVIRARVFDANASGRTIASSRTRSSSCVRSRPGSPCVSHGRARDLSDARAELVRLRGRRQPAAASRHFRGEGSRPGTTETETRLTPREQRAMNHNLAREYLWRLGYACCWEVGDYAAGALHEGGARD